MSTLVWKRWPLMSRRRRKLQRAEEAHEDLAIGFEAGVQKLLSNVDARLVAASGDARDFDAEATAEHGPDTDSSDEEY